MISKFIVVVFCASGSGTDSFVCCVLELSSFVTGVSTSGFRLSGSLANIFSLTTAEGGVNTLTEEELRDEQLLEENIYFSAFVDGCSNYAIGEHTSFVKLSELSFSFFSNPVIERHQKRVDLNNIKTSLIPEKRGRG